MTRRKIASLDDIWSGEMMGLDVDGHGILVVNIEDHIYAYADVCPHQKSRLSEGDLTQRTLRCARHHWEFDVCTGRGMNPQTACLQAVPVTLESRDIFLVLDDAHSTEAAEREHQR
jgi:toluene monooxygenase system ferredoxin subunit